MRTASSAPACGAPEGLAPAHAIAPAGSRRRARPTAAARAGLRLLERLRKGSLALETPDGDHLVFGRGSPVATMRLDNWNVFGASLRHGDIGFAESYIAGDWHTDALDRLLDVLVANREALDAAVYGSAWANLLHRVRHLLRRNTRAGAKRNIHAHYDLGNAFYALWLDPGMAYSSALFDGDERRSLERAQDAKNRRILDELGLPAGARVLEIGCGWGGFAELAARDGLRVRGLTLSTEQLGWARERLHQAGLEERAEFALQDYRDEQGRFDGVASIEMFEAVGEAYWPDYFATLARVLAPGGRAVVQTITIDDRLFARYRRGTDFIQQYVFPGGMLPTSGAFESHAERAGLRVVRSFAFGRDYARTLALWRERFLACRAEVHALGFDARFARIWEFYLAYCEAAFRHGNCDVVQFTLERR